jgi:hypothetical protein
MTTTNPNRYMPAWAYTWLSCLAVVCIAGCATPAASPPKKADTTAWTKDEVVDSYVFGYPLVVMASAHSAAMSGHDGKDAPVNTLVRADAPLPNGTDAVPLADLDTVESTAWLDLSAEPVVVSLPSARTRYLDARVLDMWTNVVWSTGTASNRRDSAAKMQTIALVPPGWDGSLPGNVARVEAPGRNLWFAVRVAASGPRDTVGERLLDDVRVAPLSDYLAGLHDKRHVRATRSKHGHGAAAGDDPFDTAGLPATQAQQVAGLDANAFFSRLADALHDYPPSQEDAHALKILADIGVKPGEPVHLPQGDALAAGLEQAHARVATPPVNALAANGWYWLGDSLGAYGEDYALRAYATYTRPGIASKYDEVYPTVQVDSQGQALDGANRYVLHFAAKALPPTRAFWTLTAYTPAGALTDARVPRRSVGSHSALRRNRDGSIDIYVSADAPARARQSNWLPAPQGPFELVLRLYAPLARATDGSWQPPAVVRQ